MGISSWGSLCETAIMIAGGLEQPQEEIPMFILNPLLLPTDAQNVKKRRVIKTF